MEFTAQGAVEYLLIIGAAVLVVSVVITAVGGVVVTSQNASDKNSVVDSFSSLKCQQDVNVLGYVSSTDLNYKCCLVFSDSINKKCSSGSEGPNGKGLGESCALPAECSSGFCESNLCVAFASGSKEIGESCSLSSDCSSNNCSLENNSCSSWNYVSASDSNDLVLVEGGVCLPTADNCSLCTTPPDRNNPYCISTKCLAFGGNYTCYS